MESSEETSAHRLEVGLFVVAREAPGEDDHSHRDSEGHKADEEVVFIPIEEAKPRTRRTWYSVHRSSLLIPRDGSIELIPFLLLRDSFQSG